MANLPDVNGCAPSALPRFTLFVTLSSQFHGATFSTEILAFQSTIDGFVLNRPDETFLPSRFIFRTKIDRPAIGWEQRAILDISTTDLAAVLRIGLFSEVTKDWGSSFLFVNGRLASEDAETAIVATCSWFGRRYSQT